MKIARHIDHARAVRWFLIIFVPIFLALSAFIGWHNQVVESPSDADLIMRALIAMAAIIAGMVLFAWKIIRPATKKAEDDHDSQQPNAGQ